MVFIFFSEFKQFFDKIENDPEFKVKVAFKMMDKDGDGLLSASDLEEHARNLHVEFNKKMQKEWMQKMDDDGDGKVSFAGMLCIFFNKAVKIDKTEMPFFTTTWWVLKL